MASIFQDSVNQSLQDQKWYVTYKGSLLIVLSGVVSILGDLAQSQDLQDLGWGSAIGVVATIAAFFVNRFTRDGVTKSAAARLEQAGAKAHLDRVSVSGVVASVADSVADAVNDAVDSAVSVAESYVGQHRIQGGLPVYDQDSTGDK